MGDRYCRVMPQTVAGDLFYVEVVAPTAMYKGKGDVSAQMLGFYHAMRMRNGRYERAPQMDVTKIRDPRQVRPLTPTIRELYLKGDSERAITGLTLDGTAVDIMSPNERDKHRQEMAKMRLMSARRARKAKAHNKQVQAKRRRKKAVTAPDAWRMKLREAMQGGDTNAIYERDSDGAFSIPDLDDD